MQIINENYKVNFCKNVEMQDKKTQIYTKTSEIPSDSFEPAVSKKSQVNFLDKLKNFFTLPPEKKYENFINEAETKIEQAANDFKEINKKSIEFYNEASEILDKTKNHIIDKNIRINAVKYRGNLYSAVGIIDDNGYVNRIIQSKNGKIHTVYDIKSKLKSGNKQLYEGKPSQEVIADCYFYDWDEKNNPQIGFMKDVKNSASEFNASYDVKHGGIKRVSKNKDKSPIALYATIKGKAYNFKFNYGKKEAEQVSYCNFGDDKSRTRYIKTKSSFIKKFNEKKMYIKYENMQNRPDRRLVIIHPKRGIKDYSWNI